MVCRRLRVVLVIAAVTLLTMGAGTARATVITGTAAGPNGGHDTWNNAANWDAGIPSGGVDAVVAAGVTAQAWNTATPAYTGSLTLGSNSTLQMGWTTSYPESLNAIGGAGVTMNEGSQLLLRLPAPDPVNLPVLTMAGDGSIHLSPSTSAHHKTRNLGTVSGPGALTVTGNNNNTLNLNAANPGWSGGFVADADDGWRVEANVSGAFGTGDVTFNARAANDRGATLQIDAPNVIADTAALFLNGPKDNRRDAKLIMNASDTVNELWIDGGQAFAGAYTNSQSWLSGGGTLTVLSGPADLPPTLSGTDIVDDVFGGPIFEDTTAVNYIVTFSDDMDAATVTAADFGNAGTASFTIGDVTKTLTPALPTSPSEFSVELLPSSAGTLQLQVLLGASLLDVGGNPLDTTSAILDDTTIVINAGNTPPTTITGNANGPNGGHDTWNNPGNWDNGIPFGPQAAIVAAGVTAEAWNVDTPAYTGSLTLENGATLQMGWTTNYPPSANALGGDITMNDGSAIRLRLPFTVDLPAITMAGDGSIHLSPSTSAHHQTRNFNGPISGPGALTVVGNNNNTLHLNVASPDWSGGFVANADDGWRVEANVSGAFGTGDVSFNARAAGDRGATLQIDADDVIGDAATLFLNGPRDQRVASKLILNASDTVLGFSLDGAPMAPGYYSSTSGLSDSIGNPLITGNGILTVSGIAVTGSAGNWRLATSAQPNQLVVDKTATDLDPFDMEITVTGGGQLREILENAINTTGEDWADYHILLGFGLGPDFVPSQPGDGLGFTNALSQAFPGLVITEDELSFDGGTVPIGGAADFALTIGLPGDEPITFTLRQFPTTGDVIPEPATLSLLGLGALALLRRRKRR